MPMNVSKILSKPAKHATIHAGAGFRTFSKVGETGGNRSDQYFPGPLNSLQLVRSLTKRIQIAINRLRATDLLNCRSGTLHTGKELRVEDVHSPRKLDNVHLNWGGLDGICHPAGAD